MKKRATGFLVIAITIFLIWGGFFSGNLIKTTYSCILLPHKEWKISLPQPGQLYVEWLDNQHLKTLEAKTFNMDRPDYFDFQLNPLLAHGQNIQQNDTLGWVYFYSDEMYRLRQELELELEKSRLKVISTGDKEAIQKEYQKNYEYALVKLENFEKIFIRKKALYEQKLISAEEWENIQGEYKILKLTAEVAKAQQEKVSTGAKSEEIDLIRRKIANIEKQLKYLYNKKQLQILTAPFSGYFICAGDENNTYSVADTDTLVAKFYVEEQDFANAQPGKQITIALPQAEKKVYGKIIHRGGYPKSMNGKLKYLILAIVENPQQEIEPFLKGSIRVPQSLSLF